MGERIETVNSIKSLDNNLPEPPPPAANPQAADASGAAGAAAPYLLKQVQQLRQDRDHLDDQNRTLLQQLNEAMAGAAAMRERLFAIIEVAEFIDDDTKHQSRAIDEVLKHDCGRDFLTRLQKAEAERDSAREKLLKCQRAMDTFCQRRERGEIKSTATYEQFRKILAETL